MSHFEIISILCLNQLNDYFVETKVKNNITPEKNLPYDISLRISENDKNL